MNYNNLVDLKDVVIDINLPKEERIIDYLKQIKNPYIYINKGCIIKKRYNPNGDTMEECLIKAVSKIVNDHISENNY